MRAAFQQWLEQLPPMPGLMACGVRLPDCTCLTRSWSDEFTEAGMENAFHCLVDAFEVLQSNALPNDRVRWVFSHGLLYGERRADGACLGLFTTRDPWGCDVTGLQQLISGFHAVMPAADFDVH